MNSRSKRLAIPLAGCCWRATHVAAYDVGEQAPVHPYHVTHWGVEGVAEVRGRGGRVPTRMPWVSGMEVATEATADAPPPRGCDEEKKIGAASLRIAAPT